MNWFSRLLKPRPQVETARRGWSYTSGVYVTEESAMQVAAFHRGVIYISSQVAKLPWEVKDKNNVVQDMASENFLLDVAPNPEMTAMDFRLCMIQTALIQGNSYAEIERNAIGKAVGIWPIRSHEVEPYRTPEGTLVYRVVGGSNYEQGADVYLPAKNVFHLKNLHTKDGIVGQGLVAFASKALGISIGADGMAGNLFQNGGLPSGVIQVVGTLSDEAHKRMKDSWKENHGGKQSAGVAILEEDAKFNPLSLSPDILQFLESRQFGVLEIARFLGVPPQKLYDITSATYSNQEQAALDVASDTFDPWIRMLELQADIKILNNRFGGRRSKIDIFELSRGDMTTRSNYYSKQMQSGALTPNEIREKEGQAPYASGDRYYIATNNFSPADRIDEIVDAQIKPKPATVAAPSKDKTAAALEEAAIEFLKGK